MLEAKFYETYYFCNVVHNVLQDQENFLRNLNDFYGDGRFFFLLQPFSKYSTFHRFIEFIVDDLSWENTSNVDLGKRQERIRETASFPYLSEYAKWDVLPIEQALEFHGLTHESFITFLTRRGGDFLNCDEEDIHEYLVFLRDEGTFDTLVEHTVKEVFHVLFQNRELMLTFNVMVSDALKREIDEESSFVELNGIRRKDGKLKRKNIPKWVQRAVFFRDRGRCVLCDKDLSGILNAHNVENYDHIVPLSQYGLNDVSNIQLLCKECNQIAKKDGSAVTSRVYQSWYKYS
ncbi:TPA: HNH endonuclease [Vibrio parahaemolyticus]|nr:HNH endonuclease [Vibrio parahaemolyticus]